MEHPREQQIEECVYRAIDRVNGLLDEQNALAKSRETVILGAQGGLDSMGFVNFIVALEEEVERSLGIKLVLSQELSTPEQSYALPLTVAGLIEIVAKS
jgi:acyl carrier protein